MDHKHSWIFLEEKGFLVQVIRMRTRSPNIRSYYDITKVCEAQDCFAGQTRDGVVFDDIREGIQLEEGATRVISGLLRISKEAE